MALLAQAGKIDDALSKAVKTFVKFDRKYEKTPVELPNEPLRMLDEAQGVLDTQTEGPSVSVATRRARVVVGCPSGLHPFPSQKKNHTPFLLFSTSG